MRDCRRQQARERKSAEHLPDGADEYRWMEPDGYNLPFMRQQVLVNTRRYRLVRRYKPEAHLYLRSRL
jgi:hypothetical protein